MPAARARVDRGTDRRGAGALHRATGVAPDHAGRGRCGHPGGRLPANATPRRASRARRAARPVRELVAAVALRRRDRRVLERPRGRVGRRREHAREDRRVGPRRGGVPRAAVPLPRRRHPAGPLALRAAAQRTRPHHGRRHDPARSRDPVRADVHLGWCRERRDVAPRLGRRMGSPRPCDGPHDVSRRDQRDGAARRPAPAARRSGRPARVPRPRPRRRCGRPVPRHAAVVHGRGVVGAAPPGRPVGGAVARPPGDGRGAGASARMGSRRCSGCGSRRAT